MPAYFFGSWGPPQNAAPSSSFHSSHASTAGTRLASSPMARPKSAGSVGGLVPPLPPDAHAGERWTTTSTLSPWDLAAWTDALSPAMMCGAQVPEAGCAVSQLAQMRTQPAPRSFAVEAVGLVC